MTRRIGIDARKIHDFGIGRHLEGLLTALAQRDDPEEFVLFLANATRELLPGELPALLDSARFRLVETRAPLYSIQEVFAFRAAPRVHGLALLHFPHYVRAAASRCRVSVTMHDAIHLQEPSSFAARLYARSMMAWSARSAAALITVSDAVRTDLESLLPESRGKWRIAPNGVDLARFALPSAAALAAFRSARGLQQDFVLLIGSHRPHKNLAAGVRAFTRLAESALAGAELVVPARDAKTASRLAPFVADIPRARLLVPVEDADLPALYAAAGVVLLPSRIEGFGLSGLEAMACGAAVLASPIAAHREILGDAAAFSASTSHADLAVALASLWSDVPRRTALARGGRARAARYPWSATASAHLDTWRSVLDDS